MALTANIETPFGIDATYHKAVSLNYDFIAQKGQVVVNCYLDEDASLDGKPLTQIIVAINQPLLALDDVSVYNAIKTDPIFSKAKLV